MKDIKSKTNWFNVLAGVFVLAAFILLIATTGAEIGGYIGVVKTSIEIKGTTILFGGGDYNSKGSNIGLMAFIFAILAFLAICIVTIIKFLKKDKNQSLNKILNVVLISAALIAILAGIFVFITKNDFVSKNGLESSYTDSLKTKMSPTYIMSGVLLILGGIFAAVDPVLHIKD